MQPLRELRALNTPNVAQHTPGPWAVANGVIVEAKTGEPIPTTQANLGMCAAAPTYFDTLEKIKGQLVTTSGFVDQGAVKRAIGYIDTALNYAPGS